MRVEDKGVISAFHWRGRPRRGRGRGRGAGDRRARRGGRACAALGPQGARGAPAGAHRQGRRGSSPCCANADVDHALYVGDDNTDLDAFRGLDELVEAGRLTTALRIGVRSDEGPSELADAADVLVDGPAGVRAVLEALLEA